MIITKATDLFGHGTSRQTTMIMIRASSLSSPSPSSLVKELQAVGFPAVRAAKVHQPLLDSTVATTILVEIKNPHTSLLGGNIAAQRQPAGYWEVVVGHVGVAVPRKKYLPQYKELGERMRIWQKQHKAQTFAQPHKALPPPPHTWAVRLMAQPLVDGWLPIEWAMMTPPSSLMTAPYRLWALNELPKNGRVNRPLVLNPNDYHARIGLGSIGQVW